MKNSRFIIPLMITLAACACATSRQNTESAKSQQAAEAVKNQPEATPTKEDFTPLSSPVIIKGSPDVQVANE